jgi:hypothetical protein
MALRKTGEIMAVDEKGNRHKIIKYTDFEKVDTFGASEEVQGLNEYHLAATNEAVNKVSDSEFVVVASNLKLRPE